MHRPATTAFYVIRIRGLMRDALLGAFPRLVARAAAGDTVFAGALPATQQDLDPTGDPMTALALRLVPIHNGWVIELTDGRELARFTGFAARRRALRYLADIERGGGGQC